MLGWVFYGFVSPPQPAQYQANGAGATHATFSQSGSGVDDECGDITDASNVQHLGHHPDQFANCLKKVNPQLLKQATGKTLDELLGGSTDMSSMH